MFTSDILLDLSPRFSPDGSALAFQQVDANDNLFVGKLLIKPLTGGESQSAGSGFDPRWAPNGDLLAYLRRNGKTFELGVSHRDGTGERALVRAHHSLGGGFVSRLMTEVREKRGLTYGVGSGFSPGLHAGAFSIGLQTRPDQADEALRVSRDVLARFVAEGPTQAELQAAKDNLTGGFALRIDSNRKLLDNVANIAWNRLPLDYLDTWTQRVSAVTADEVRAAFQRKLQPDRMATVVVGARPSK